MGPALSSAASIAEDEYDIWNGAFSVGRGGTSGVGESLPPIATPASQQHSSSSSSNSKLIIPLQLQLRPFFDTRMSSGVFRLFFSVDFGVMFAASHSSVWGFYLHTWAARSVVVRALMSFAAESSTR